MAYRIADTTTLHLQHDLDRINVIVNRALEQYPETWKCNSALIVTWRAYGLSDPSVSIRFVCLFLFYLFILFFILLFVVAVVVVLTLFFGFLVEVLRTHQFI